MPVALDIEAKLDRRAAEAAAREVTQLFSRVGANISGDLGKAFGRAVGAFDTSAARREVESLAATWRRAADVEVDAARRMEVAARRASDAVAKYGADSARAMQAQAVAARTQRDFTDAMIANEAAHKAHSAAAKDSAATATMMGRAWNAVGVGSLAVFTGAMLESTKVAGDFQQSQQRLVSSAGETAANLKVVSDGILQMAGQVGYSAQELSNGMYTVEKAGYRGADSVNVLRSAAQLAKAENADLKEVLNGLTTSMHDFGYGSDRAAEVASKMNTAVGEAKTNLQEFSGALHSVEPIAAAAGLKLEDVYGSLAQITQSGTSADQGAQNMAHSISQLMKPTQQMREEMGQLGIDARDVQAHLGERGFAGTVQYLSDTIRQHMSPAGQVVIDTMFKSQQATDSANKMFQSLPPAAQSVAQAIRNNAEAYKQFRKDRGGLSVEQANEVEQWWAIEKKVDGFSNALKSGQGDVQTYEQALALMTGGQDSLRTVLQLVGDNAQATNDKIKAVKDTTAETDGTVKGFNETQQTLNAKMADAKAAFGAAAIEIGSAFIPVMTDVAKVAKEVGDFMAQHPAIMHSVVEALGLLGGAWLTFKAINVVGSILTPITTALGGMAAAEDAAAASAGGLGGALRTVGALAGPVAVGAAVGLPIANATLHSDAVRGAMASNPLGHNPISEFINRNTPSWLGGDIVDSHGDVTAHARGGAVHGRGPKGIDSVLTWLAPGEHVLTHHDVAAMGGHANIYAMRQALHRQEGGAIGPDVQAAASMVGTPYSQGARNDCSGMVGRVVNAALGIPGGGLPTTKNMGEWLAQRGFVSGVGPTGTISVGWYDHGPNPNDGHTAMTLSNGMNAESGGSHGNFLVGPGAAGANSSQFDHHMYLPQLFGQGPAVGGMGSFGALGAMGGYGGMGGSIPAGGVAGTGPGGQAGYYMANPQRVASANERLRHIDQEIHNAEERRGELKANAKQSERDRIDEEIRHLKEERASEEQRLAEAKRGTFHAMPRGRRSGMGGGANLPVELPDHFGLDKGLPGLATWAVAFLEDLALGPMETAAMAALGGGADGLGDAGAGMPGSSVADGGLPSLASFSAPAVGGGGVKDVGPVSGGSGGGSAPFVGGASGAASTDWHSDPWFTAPASANYKAWYPRSAPTDASLVPPNVAEWARQRGLIDSSGMYVGQMGTLPPPKSTTAKVGRYATGGLVPQANVTPDPNNQKGGGHGALTPNWGPGMQFGPPPQDWWTKPVNPDDILFPDYMPPGERQRWLDRWGTQHKRIKQYATGGPSGTDTIPAWLSPGEFIVNSKATNQYLPWLQLMNAGHYDEGGQIPQQPGPAQPAAAPGGPGGLNAAAKTAQSQAPGPMKAAGPLAVSAPIGGMGGPGGKGSQPSSDIHNLPGLATPGKDAQGTGAGLPASPGIGFGGGVIGSAEGAAETAASMAANAFAPGSGQAAGQAMGIAFQELNRLASYGAQAAGIGVEGVLESLLPSSSAVGGDWAKTIPGRLLMGVTGVRPTGQNTAGATTQPASQSEGGQSIGNQFYGPVNIHGVQNPGQFNEWSDNQAQQANGAYPFSTAGR